MKKYLIVDHRYLVGNTETARKGPADQVGAGFEGHPSQKYSYDQDLGDFFRGASARYYDFREGDSADTPPYYINDSDLLPNDSPNPEEVAADENFIGFTVSDMEFIGLEFDPAIDEFQLCWENQYSSYPVGTALFRYLSNPVTLGDSYNPLPSAYFYGPAARLHRVTLEVFESGWVGGSAHAGISTPVGPPSAGMYYLENSVNMQNWSNYIRPGDNPTAVGQVGPAGNWRGILGRENVSTTLTTPPYSQYWTRLFYDHAHEYDAATIIPNPDEAEEKVADITAEYSYYNKEYESFTENEDLKETHLPNPYIILAKAYSQGGTVAAPAGPFAYLNDLPAGNPKAGNSAWGTYEFLSTLGSSEIEVAEGDYPQLNSGRFALPEVPGQINLNPYGPPDDYGTPYFSKNYFQKFSSINMGDFPNIEGTLDAIDLRMKHVGYSEQLMRVFGALDNLVMVERNMKRFPFHVRVHFEARNSKDQALQPPPGDSGFSRGAHFASHMHTANLATWNNYGGSVYDWLIANIIRLNIDPTSKVSYMYAGGVGSAKPFSARYALLDDSLPVNSQINSSAFLCADMTELIIASRNLMEEFPEGPGPDVQYILSPLIGQTDDVGVYDKGGIIIGAGITYREGGTWKQTNADIGNRAQQHAPILSNEKFELFVVYYKEFLDAVRRSWSEALGGQKAYSETVAFKVAKYKTNDQGDVVGQDPVQSFYLPNLPDMLPGPPQQPAFTDIKFYDTQVKYGQKYKYIVTAYNIVVGNQYRYSDVYRWPESHPLPAWPDRLPDFLGFPSECNYPRLDCLPFQPGIDDSVEMKVQTEPAVAHYLVGNVQPCYGDPAHVLRPVEEAMPTTWSFPPAGGEPPGRSFAPEVAPTKTTRKRPGRSFAPEVAPLSPLAALPEALLPPGDFWEINTDEEFGTPGFGFYLDMRERRLHGGTAQSAGNWVIVPLRAKIDIPPASVLYKNPLFPLFQGYIKANALAEIIEEALNSATVWETTSTQVNYQYRVRFVWSGSTFGEDQVGRPGYGQFVIATVAGIRSTFQSGNGPIVNSAVATTLADWDIPWLSSMDPPDKHLIRLNSETGPHGLAPTNILQDDDNGTAQFNVHDFPSVLLIEEPYCEFDPIQINDYPPLYPDVKIVPFRGISNKIRILFNQTEGEDSLNPDSLIIDQTDIENYNNQRIFQGRAVAAGSTPGDPIVFKSDDHGISFQVYRTTTRPTTYEDFSGHLVTVVNTPGTTSAAYEDAILPNTQYYYTFRAIDGHQGLSFPTAVYRVQLVDDNGRIYPIIETITMSAPETRSLTMDARKYLQIGPSLSQAIVNTGSLVQDDSAGFPEVPPINVHLDTVEKSIWADQRVFKLRITSKHTGKKIDLNINFDENPKVNPNE